MKTQLIIAALPFVMTNGCAFGIDGSGITKTETRSVAVFNGINLECHANVYFIQGDEQSVKVEAEDNIISHITTEVKNMTLVISTDNEKFTSHQDINVYVTAKELCLLEVSGSGNMVGKSHINCDDMTFNIAGSGDITADIRSLAMKVSVSGSGNLNLSGTTTGMDIKIAGSGKVNAKDLQSMNSTVSVAGSGSSTINTKDELNVSITGSGNVHYVGDPKLKTSITGSGKVSKI